MTIAEAGLGGCAVSDGRARNPTRPSRFTGGSGGGELGGGRDREDQNRRSRRGFLGLTTYRAGVTVRWSAYVDESMRQRRDGSGLYVLAAVVLADDGITETRETARSLGQGPRRFHWRDAMPADRRKAASVVGGLGAVHLVVVGTGLDNARQERGRRQCMTRLLWELGEAGVDDVWLDARRPVQNAMDIKLVNVLRTRREIARKLRVDFAQASAEPLVWLPDIVAGAVSAARGDRDDQYLTPLEPMLTEYPIWLN